MTDVSSPGASSSTQIIAPSIPPGPPLIVVGKCELDDMRNDDEAPEKVQKTMSVCVGVAAADKKGEVRAEEYDEDLKKFAEEYREASAAGECLIHIRKRNSSNKDLRALNGLAEGAKFHKVNLKGKVDEAIITNSAKSASLIEGAKCQTVDDVVREVEKEVMGKD